MRLGKSLWWTVLLTGLIAISCSSHTFGQGEFMLYISPTPKPGLRATAGEELRFVITAALPDTAALSEKVELDVVLSAAQRGERREFFDAAWSLNPSSIGRGESTALIVRISVDQPPNLVTILVRGRFRGNEVLAPIPLTIIGKLTAQLSHQTTYKNRLTNITITVAPSDVLVNGVMFLPGEGERQFAMKGNYTFAALPRDVGKITILISAQDYATSRLEVSVVEETFSLYVWIVGIGVATVAGVIIGTMLWSKGRAKRERATDVRTGACPVCGKPVTTRFCPYCGIRIPEAS